MYGVAKIQERWGFRIGDIVRFTTSTDPDDGVRYGQEGIVCSLDDDYGCENVGVRWDIELGKYHSCSGKCENHHGWWVPREDIELVRVDIGEIQRSDNTIESLIGLF